jgi:hypothetical protein
MLDVTLGDQRQRMVVQSVLQQHAANQAGSRGLDRLNRQAGQFMPPTPFKIQPLTQARSMAPAPGVLDTTLGNFPSTPMPAGTGPVAVPDPRILALVRRQLTQGVR